MATGGTSKNEHLKTTEAKTPTTTDNLAELDVLANTLNSGKSIVDDWLAQSAKRSTARPSPSARLALDYASEAAQAHRPARLGIGAKPSTTSNGGLGAEMGILGAYQLRAQLTGAKLPTGTKRAPLSAVFAAGTNKMGKTTATGRPTSVKSGGDDEGGEGESRAKSAGRGVSAPPRGASIVPSASLSRSLRGRKRRQDR